MHRYFGYTIYRLYRKPLFLYNLPPYPSDKISVPVGVQCPADLLTNKGKCCWRWVNIGLCRALVRSNYLNQWSSQRTEICISKPRIGKLSFSRNVALGWVGLWGFLWWEPSAKRRDHHGVSSGWSSVWHRSNTGLSSTRYEQIPTILGLWPFWLIHFFPSIIFWRAYG